MEALRRLPRFMPLIAVAGLVVVIVWLGVGLGSSRPTPAASTAGSMALTSPSFDAGRVSPSAPSPLATASASIPAGPATPGSAASAAPPSIPGSAIVPGEVGRTSLALSATYDAQVQLGFDNRRFDVQAGLSITNTSGGPVDRIELNTAAARLGSLRLDAVRVDGQRVSASVDDQTIVVPLGGVLPPDASAQVEVQFRSTLRSGLKGSDWMFTRVNGIVDAYRWLPWISQRRAFNRPNHGDPFVTPTSPRVRVSVTTDRPLTLATTGQRTAVDGLRQTFEATNVRDFNLTGAPDYRVSEAAAGGVTIRAFTRPGGLPAGTLLAEARRALGAFGQRLGAYPYSAFSVAQSAGGYAVESPGLIWLPTGAPNLSYLVHHESAHQWFYGIVGSDQAQEPFADEAPADFVARHVLGSRRASRCATAALDRTIYAYSSACYYEVVYIQGGALIDDARRRMGDTAFWRAMRGYVEANRFGLSGTRSLLDALDAATSENLRARYAARFPTIF